ncbi:hypothetical protein BGX31_001633 [Mortierella sp. GBA43]|nr:hypothetical protein BGX31_001633 [Mortierella sp. GBA43]
MAQLLESTKNYLKTSTKIGRRMSQYRDDTSGSQASLKSTPSDATPSDHNKSVSEDKVANIVSRKISPDSHEAQEERRKSSERTSRPRSRRGDERESSNSCQDQDHTSEHMENGIPRGRSPALSMSNTVSTATSSYDMRPSDYPSMRHYQAHVWRRNLLEESIMHSLKLGYAERHRPSSRLPPKKDSMRARKAREQAILAAAIVPDQHQTPLPGLDSDRQAPHAQEESIIDKTLRLISERSSQARSRQSQQTSQQSSQFRHPTNSPYQMDHNASMTNITQSVASFTLELPDHHASHVMNLSAVPNLFKVKTAVGVPIAQRPRRNSRTSHVGGVAPSPRVLTGKRPVVQIQQTPLPQLKDEDEDSADAPPTPSSAIWAESVVASLKVVGDEEPKSTEDEPKTPQAPTTPEP